MQHSGLSIEPNDLCVLNLFYSERWISSKTTRVAPFIFPSEYEGEDSPKGSNFATRVGIAMP